MENNTSAAAIATGNQDISFLVRQAITLAQLYGYGQQSRRETTVEKERKVPALFGGSCDPDCWGF